MRRALLLLLVVLNWLAWGAVLQLHRPQPLEVVFFDVGQGDAALVKTPGRHLILIDGGYDSRVVEKLAQEMPFWYKEIDLIILSHPHLDHLGGLLHVLERYQVNHIVWFPFEMNTPEYYSWIAELEDRSVFQAAKGMKIRAGGTVFSILYPSPEDSFVDANNASIVMRVENNDISYLFTGDIYADVEEKIAFPSDILKVAHHGSNTSSSLKFLKEVNPQKAVISVGEENKYGHPSSDVITRFQELGIEVWRTDEEGDIRIISQ